MHDAAGWVGPTPPEEVRAQRHLEALLRSSEPLEPLTDPVSVARLAAEQGAALIPGIQCAVVVPDSADGSVLRVAGASGPVFSALVGSTMPLDGSLAQRALRTGVAVETGDAARDSPIAARIPDAPKTARLVPLRVTETGGQAVTLGVIGYYRVAPGGFIVEEQRLLDEFAVRVAVALQRANLFGEVDAARERTAQLAGRLAIGVEAAMELGGELDPRRVIRRLIEQVAAAVGADRASFGRVDGDAVVIEDSLAAAGEALVPGARWDVDAVDLLRTAVRDRRPARASRSTASPAAKDLMHNAEHVLIVPLLAQSRPVAIISAGRMRDEPFDDEALAVMQQVGTIAVLALRNARLFEARRDFMNMAAHELRTPLTVLNGYLSMLRDGTFGAPSEHWEHPVEVMAGKVAELARLVDDLLIGARLERGVVHAEAERVDLVALAAGAVERAGPRAALLGGDILFNAPEIEVPIHGDVDNIGKILDNLLNNALTYTLGPPHVGVTVGRAGDLATVAVEDRGRGIPEELHERVFEQFFRIEDRHLGYPPGTGLGLYISRHLAEAHDGRLRIARSRPGAGSVFVLELPVLLSP
jgi:signal transduction histidine kinase